MSIDPLGAKDLVKRICVMANVRDSNRLKRARVERDAAMMEKNKVLRIIRDPTWADSFCPVCTYPIPYYETTNGCQQCGRMMACVTWRSREHSDTLYAVTTTCCGAEICNECACNCVECRDVLMCSHCARECCECLEVGCAHCFIEHPDGLWECRSCYKLNE